jgi:subtilisin-like proprotein convertase family protein
VKYLEHVQAHVTLAASKRGDVQISLTSPKGTKSLLIDKRPKDYSRAGFNDWPFLTVIFSIGITYFSSTDILLYIQ